MKKKIKMSQKSAVENLPIVKPIKIHEKGESVSKKKKKRIFKKSVEKPDDPVKQLKKVVANIQKSKDKSSSNWDAFKNTALYNEMKSKSAVENQGKKVGFRKFKPRSKKLTTTAPQKPEPISKEDLLGDEVTVMPSTDELDGDLYAETDKERCKLTRCIAMDCEMVGVGDGKENALARVSLVNQLGECIYDKFVKPKEEVVDYRTHVSGVRPSDLRTAEKFEVVQQEVANILKGKILVGHSITNDMKVLLINHHPKMIRDTSRFKPFRDVTGSRSPSLKKLSAAILGVTIQSGEHNSVEDAKATMQLYNLYQKEWESHRLQRGAMRKEKAVAAARRTKRPTPTSKIGKKTGNNTSAETPKYSLMDEYAAF